MALVRKCDRCGNETTLEESSKNGWTYIQISDNRIEYYTTYDICPQCYKRFTDYMKGRLFDNEER